MPKAALGHARPQETAALALLGVCALSVATAALLAWALTRSMVKPVSEAIRLSERIAEGDQSSDLPHGGAGKLGRLLLALKCMQDRLHTLVDVRRASAYTIVLASDDFATGNSELSHRTEIQSARPQKTALEREPARGHGHQQRDRGAAGRPVGLIRLGHRATWGSHRRRRHREDGRDRPQFGAHREYHGSHRTPSRFASASWR
jgi:hypothetical protein